MEMVSKPLSAAAAIRAYSRLFASIRVHLRLALPCVAAVMLAGHAHAQSATDRVFPPGGQRGTTVTLTFPAMDKTESASLVVDGEGVRPLGPFVKGVGKVE